MGTPAIVKGNRITGICPSHLVPSASGTAPAGPRPFSAPIDQGTVSSVLIGGQPAAVIGSSGANDAQTHNGIVDGPFAAPNGRIGRITSGSATVLIQNKMAATVSSTATCCVAPGKLVPGVPTVLIG
ncbi:MAG: PAAR domain-containing protein [Candidatus Limnocylindrales bacterium]